MYIDQITLKKIQFRVSTALDDNQMRAMAENLRARIIEDDVTHQTIVQFNTWLLGQEDTVYFRKEAQFQVPRSWWQHLKLDLRSLLCRYGFKRLAGLLKIQRRTLTQMVTDRQRVPLRVCPHLNVPTSGGGEHAHIAWMDGREDEAEKVRKKLLCNGRTSKKN